VNALLEKRSLGTFGDKDLHLQEFVDTTSLETLRIMKDEFVVAPENQFVLDVVHATLKEGICDLRASCPSARRGTILTPLDPSTWDGSI
jgi:hypothetical protein